MEAIFPWLPTVLIKGIINHAELLSLTIIFFMLFNMRSQNVHLSITSIHHEPFVVSYFYNSCNIWYHVIRLEVYFGTKLHKFIHPGWNFKTNLLRKSMAPLHHGCYFKLCHWINSILLNVIKFYCTRENHTDLGVKYIILIITKYPNKQNLFRIIWWNFTMWPYIST